MCGETPTSYINSGANLSFERVVNIYKVIAKKNYNISVKQIGYFKKITRGKIIKLKLINEYQNESKLNEYQ